MSEPAVEGLLAAAGAATFTMLAGILLAQLVPRFRNYRRMYAFGAALAGTAFVVLLAVASIANFVAPLLPITVGAVLLAVAAAIFFAASKGHYFGTVSDYRIIARTLLIAGGAVLALGVVVVFI